MAIEDPNYNHLTGTTLSPYSVNPEHLPPDTHDSDIIRRILGGPYKTTCRQCGTVIAGLDEMFVCTPCSDAWEKQRREYDRQDRARQLTEEALYQGLLTKFTANECRFEKAKNTQAVQKLKEWKMENNIYIFGESGVGKSFAARCAIRRAIDNGNFCCEVTSRGMIEISMNWFKSKLPWQMISQDAAVLLVDDIDKLNWSDKNTQIFFELVDSRSVRGLWTIFTANIDRLGLRQLITSGNKNNSSITTAIFGRMEPCEVIHVTGDNMRRKRDAES